MIDLDAARLERLLPDRGESQRRRAAGAASTRPRSRHDDRPYTFTNFAVTVDGHATIDGRSGAIGSDTDTAMLVGLRDARRRGDDRRRARCGPSATGGSSRDPEQARATASGAACPPTRSSCSSRAASTCPGTRALFTDGGGRGADLHRLRRRAARDRDAGPRRPPRRAASTCARRCATCAPSAAIRSLLCEGGPHLHAELLEAGLVDELFVTLGPLLAGGDGPGLAAGLRRERRSTSSSPGSCATGASSSPATGVRR